MRDGLALQQLTLAVRASYDAAARPALVAIADRICWEAFSALAARHRIEALAWDGLVACGHSGHEPLNSVLRSRSQRIAATYLGALSAHARIAHRFASAGIDILFLKGITLAAIAYPRPQAKDSCDIDILVDPVDIEVAGRLLRELGYQLVIPGQNASLASWHKKRKESVWIDPTSGRQIDLHSRLADNPAMIAGIGMRSPRRSLDVGGARLETLAELPLFAYLCVHGASSAWFRLKWLADLHAFILASRPACLSGWHSSAKEFGAGRPSILALRLLKHHFQLAWTDRSPAQDPALRLLERIASGQLHNALEPTQRPLGTVGIHLTQMLLKPGFAYSAMELARQARDLIGQR